MPRLDKGDLRHMPTNLQQTCWSLQHVCHGVKVETQYACRGNGMGGCRAAISAMKRVRGYAWGYHKTSVMGISQKISHTTTLNVSRYGISPENARDQTQMSCAIRMHRQMSCAIRIQMSCAIRMHRTAIDFELHLCLHVSRYVIFPQNVGHKTPTFCLKRRCSLKEGSVKGAAYLLIC